MSGLDGRTPVKPRLLSFSPSQPTNLLCDVAIWDSDLFNDSARIAITISYADPPDGADDDPIWTSNTTLNSAGEVEYELKEEWLQGESRNNLTLGLMVADSRGWSSKSGPTIALIAQPTPTPTPTPSHSSAAKHTGSSNNKLGVEIGVPIAIVFFAALCIGLFLGFRRRKQGYLGGGRRRSQRMKGHGEAQLTADDLRVPKGRQSFVKDEPVQGGVELQPRVGHRREDSIGGNLISPVSPISPIRTTNVFRDEIERQKTAGR